MTQSCRLVLAPLALLASSVALAQAQPGPGAENVRYTYATVLSATPVYETIRFSEPREECEDERVVYRERDSGTAGTVIGAIVGAAVGNQVGGGDGRRAATVAPGIVASGLVPRRRSAPH